MNICVWPAVKISLITPRLESKAAYLAGQQAAGLRIQPPGGWRAAMLRRVMARLICCICLSSLFLSRCLWLRVAQLPPRKRMNLLKGAKKKKFFFFYCPTAQSSRDMSAGACYGCWSIRTESTIIWPGVEIPGFQNALFIAAQWRRRVLQVGDWSSSTFWFEKLQIKKVTITMLKIKAALRFCISPPLYSVQSDLYPNCSPWVSPLRKHRVAGEVPVGLKATGHNHFT